jgi:hypothetical protein
MAESWSTVKRLSRTASLGDVTRASQRVAFRKVNSAINHNRVVSSNRPRLVSSRGEKTGSTK